MLNKKIRRNENENDMYKNKKNVQNEKNFKNENKSKKNL